MTRSEFFEKIKSWTIAFGKKAWAYIKVAKLELIVLGLAFVVDLVSKAIVENTMSVGQTVVLIPNFLQFTFCYNDMAAFGGAFGLEKVLSPIAIRVIFVIITFIAVGLFSYFLYRNRGKSKVERIALALIIAGALGNLVDRLFIPAGVRDFIEIVYFGLNIPKLGTSFAIFNIADAALVVGVILFLVYIIFLYKADNKPEPVADDGEAADTTENDNTVENAADTTETEPEVDTGVTDAELDAAKTETDEGDER